MLKCTFLYIKKVIDQLTRLMAVIKVETARKVSFAHCSQLNAEEANGSLQRKWPIN